MLPEQKQVIKENWNELMQISEIDLLVKFLEEKSIFTQTEAMDTFSSENERFFSLILDETNESAFVYLVQWMSSMGYDNLSDNLALALPMKKSTSSIETKIKTLNIPIDDSQTPLTVKVQYANEFCDTTRHNPNLEFYNSRSKRRGKVLIINNYAFNGIDHPYRNGATVDQENLEELFSQMGGWVVETHKNITAEEIGDALKDFVKDEGDQKCDICFVIVMSHGGEEWNQTIVYGIDGKSVSTDDIQNAFTNENCSLFRGKPKVFLFQVCRGRDVDTPRIYTEIDGVLKSPAESPAAIPKQQVSRIFRPIDDMLIGFATMLGSKAHRDPYRGTWYIELICQNFMNLARTEPVERLLAIVDLGLRRRMSEKYTVQTSETISKGFKTLYLNPGIYELDGTLKRF